MRENTKTQCIDELVEMRQRLTEFEKSKTEFNWAKKVLGRISKRKSAFFRWSAILKYLALIILAVCIGTICTPLLSAQNNQVKKVLVLNSYHPGFAWSDGIMEGIRSEFRASGQNIRIDIEYMDTKRISDESHYENLYKLYRHKFSKRGYDLILTSDDNAFNFMLKYHDKLFPDNPVVFCGLNSMDKSLEDKLSRRGWITGSVEMYDIQGNLDLILKLHPDVKQIVVISDKTLSSQKCKRKVQEAARSLPASIKFNYLKEDAYMEDILAQVKVLPPDSIVLLMSFFKDREGKYYTPEAGGKMISENSPVPAYSAWDFYFGQGITGGLITSSTAQGEMGARIALRILNGEKISDIPASREPATYHMFDYKQMQRFGIEVSDLPEGSIVINKPYSFYSEHKVLIWSAIVSTAGLVLIIFIFAANIIIRRRAGEEIKRLKEFNEGIVQSMAEGIVMEDVDGYITFVNAAGASMVGYTPEELLGKHWTVMLPPDQHHSVQAADERRMRGESDRYELELLHKEGRRLSILVSGRPRFEEGRFIGTLAVFIDITQRKQAEEEIIKEKKLSENIITTVPDSLLVIDKDLMIKSANRTFYETFKTEPKKVMGSSITEILQDKEGKLSTELIKLFGTEDMLENFELHYQPVCLSAIPTGQADTGRSEKFGERVFNIRARGIIIAEEEEEEEELVVIEDITEKKQVEEALRRFSEELEVKVEERTKELKKEHDYTRHLIESSPDFQMTLDRKGRIMDVNDAFEKIIGKNRKDVIGTSIYEYFPREETEKVIAEIFEKKQVRNIELSTNIPKRGTLTFNLSRTVFTTPEGELGIYASGRDVTEIKRLQEEELKAKDVKLIHAARLSTLGEMATAMAHEINQPLTIISLAAEGISRDIKKNRLDISLIPHDIEEVLENVKRIDRIITHMRTFARQPEELESAEPEKLLNNAFVMLGEQFRVHNISISRKIEKNLPVVEVDPNQLEQVFINILINARQVLDEKGDKAVMEGESFQKQLMCSISRENDYVVFEFADNAYGVPDEIKMRLFEPFFTTREVGQGTGLGLSIVYNIVTRSLGGRIWVEDNEMGGASFKVALPVKTRTENRE